MNDGHQFSASGVTLYAGLSADELRYYTVSGLDEFTNNAITEANHSAIEYYYWIAPYTYIYTVNLALERLAVSTSLSAPVSKQLTGEAKFIRAFCYFYLVNLFGDVPLITVSDYRINEKMGRSAAASVYQQIKKDSH